MGFDSLAGATVQAQYRGGAGAPAERPSRAGERPVRGWAWVDNDVVNVFGTLGGAVVAVVLWAL
jgi:uncharacterized membrane protein